MCATGIVGIKVQTSGAFVYHKSPTIATGATSAPAEFEALYTNFVEERRHTRWRTTSEQVANGSWFHRNPGGRGGEDGGMVHLHLNALGREGGAHITPAVAPIHSRAIARGILEKGVKGTSSVLGPNRASSRETPLPITTESRPSRSTRKTLSPSQIRSWLQNENRSPCPEKAVVQSGAGSSLAASGNQEAIAGCAQLENPASLPVLERAPRSTGLQVNGASVLAELETVFTADIEAAENRLAFAWEAALAQFHEDRAAAERKLSIGLRVHIYGD